MFLAQTVTTDDRNWLMQRLMSMDIKGTFAYLYPKIHALVRNQRHPLDERKCSPLFLAHAGRREDSPADDSMFVRTALGIRSLRDWYDRFQRRSFLIFTSDRIS